MLSAKKVADTLDRELTRVEGKLDEEDRAREAYQALRKAYEDHPLYARKVAMDEAMDRWTRTDEYADDLPTTPEERDILLAALFADRGDYLEPPERPSSLGYDPHGYRAKHTRETIGKARDLLATGQVEAAIRAVHWSWGPGGYGGDPPFLGGYFKPPMDFMDWIYKAKKEIRL